MSKATTPLSADDTVIIYPDPNEVPENESVIRVHVFKRDIPKGLDWSGEPEWHRYEDNSDNGSRRYALTKAQFKQFKDGVATRTVTLNREQGES